ncbi:hypothetical protein BDV95DRAFT_382862 [Massariosphaeria phaeospora]|uniref:Rhodopsin domain-containing protein n=1 Tax=Massariosphaeria phaeospora TaxID=100035 RepID=A0A7C8IAL9_9PLEO|nr:hypothetical protein BDV95DRAFT_382862 [Massariosphaeria phaeospora]
MGDDNGPRTVEALWAMTAISLVFMGLRFVCKILLSRRLGTDDAILLLAWILTCVYSALITVSVQYGMGKRGINIVPGNEVPMLKYLFLGEFFTLVAIPISKTSFAVTLLRLVTRKWEKWFIWAIIITMNVTMWLVAILLFAQCRPIAKNWNSKVEGSCWGSRIQDRYSVFAGAYSALLDVILASFPWIIIWRLQMNTREKLGVVIAMSLGFLAGITAAVKTSYLPGVKKFEDQSYSLADLLIWSMAETSVTIIAASIPFFRVFVQKASSGGLSGPYRQSYRLESSSNLRRSRGISRHITVAEIDEMSDNGIAADLPIQGGTIVKGTEVTVEYEVDKPGV